jgi:formamidopyrimidine-DNA glycosylase
MPELPEVETVRSGLQRLLPNKKVVSVVFDWPKSFPNSQNDINVFLIGAKVIAVRRRAKVLMIDLDTKYSLVTHLKMTGQLVFVPKEAPLTQIETEARFGAGHPNDSLISQLPDKSTRVTILFSDGSQLFFNDQRKFGWMRLLPTSEIKNIDFMKTVGPEPLESSFSSDIFISRLLKRKNSNIKAVLLDQKILAGVGNIYADESLFLSGINPTSIVSAIPKSKLKILHKELIEVLKLSIAKGGSTNKNYVNAEGQKGSYMDFAKIFRRDNQPCVNCGTIIIKTRVAGRGTHICPKCQKEYKL